MNLLPLPVHIQAMFDSVTYLHPVDHIEMIQTHISWVFLTGDYAYKVKKPLNLGFLDFSTLAKRKFYCEQELMLNRRLSANLYIEVLPLHQHGDDFELGGAGEVVDYALKMQQFDQSGLLDQCLRDHHFDPLWMDELAQQTACFHAKQESMPAFAQPQMLADHIQHNLDIAAKHVVDGLDEHIQFDLNCFAREELERQWGSLIRRQHDGFIRPCHGDLHLKNITLINNSPCIFDCIEFNDEFRIIDTMNDVAFLVMDCDAHGRCDLAFRFLSRYLEFAGDYAGLMLLNLYLFYRATVRGKVSLLLAEEFNNEDECQLQFEESVKYFNLAATYTRSKQAELFVIGGLSGSGKSHLALLGCGVERAMIIRSDATRKRIAHDFPKLNLYGREMHAHTYKTMLKNARTALNAGFSVILDATFLSPAFRLQAYKLAESEGVKLNFFWLDIERGVLEKQIRQRAAVANDISDADLSVLKLQLSEYQRPDEYWVQFLYSTEIWPVSI